MKISMRFRAMMLIAFAILIFASVAMFRVKEKIMPPATVAIRLGIEGQADAKAQGFDVINHPSGLYFYAMNWSDPSKPGTVKLESGKNSFEVNNVHIVNGTGDSDLPQDGVGNWSILFNVSASKTASYEEARDKTMALLGQLRAAGWRRYIKPTGPRLAGREAMLYELSESGMIYSLDSAYTPTIEEWKRLVGVEPVWSFYANGIFVDLTISYQASGPNDTGTYLMDIQASTAADRYSVYFSDSVERRRQWQKYLSDELKPARKERLAKEADLEVKGYAIDAAYQEPPFEAPDFSDEAGVAQ